VNKKTSSQNGSPAELVGEILSKETLDQMATIMSTRNGLPNMISSLMTAIGSSQDSSNQADMSNLLNSLMKSIGN
jgi:hypothetical protein